MVKCNSHLDTTFSALSDPTRRSILARLMDGVLTVSDIAQPYDMSLAAVSKHLRVLSHAGLITQETKGRNRHCRLSPARLHEAAQWIHDYERFWTESFDALSGHLATLKTHNEED